MDQSSYLVDILDKAGLVLAQKPRKDIVKGIDIYHAVYILLLTPDGKVAVSLIANRQDLPNLHAGKHGCTAATIRRHGETAQDAAIRAVKDELNINAIPELFYEKFEPVDNTYRMVGYYTVVSDVPTSFSTNDISEIVTFTKPDFTDEVRKNPDKFTPLLRRFWGMYLES